MSHVALTEIYPPAAVDPYTLKGEIARLCWMPRQQLPPQIKKITVIDRVTGKPVVRYQVTVDAGTRDVLVENADGKSSVASRRVQTRKRYPTEKAARAALAEIQHTVSTGTYVVASELTVERACADWLAGKYSIRPTTRAAYEHALRPLRTRD